MSSKPDSKHNLDEQRIEEKRQGRFDYDKTAFVLRRRYSNIDSTKPFTIRDREQHREVISYAIKNNLYLWYAAVVEDGNHKTRIHPPYIVDWDSIPGGERRRDDEADKKEYPDDLKCPKCGKICSSSSGYTLHLKSHDEQDEQAGTSDQNLCCPACGKQCTSTSGFTLHKKRCGVTT